MQQVFYLTYITTAILPTHYNIIPISLILFFKFSYNLLILLPLYVIMKEKGNNWR